MPHGKRIQFDPHSDELGDAGCPVCDFLRGFQSRYPRILHSEDVRALCGFHTWQVASVVDAVTAAKIFLRLLDEKVPTGQFNRKCDLCTRVKAEEISKIREFCASLNGLDYRAVSNKCGNLCLRHAASVSSPIPAGLRSNIQSVLQKRVMDLKHRLSLLVRDSTGGQPGRAGILGRVAEFLVAQRGLKND